MLARIFHHNPRILLPARSYSQVAALKTSSHVSRHSHQQQSQKCIREQLRELLRETAQPVAVVTAFMPSVSPSSRQTHSNPHALHHGATLSSFTSIAMDPYPLITFALRIPSRMATTLNSAASTPKSNDTRAHLVINILSASQSKHAVAFSRPDLYPTPFTDSDIEYTLTQEGLPVLEGSLGAMSCRLVGRGLPLYDMDLLTDTEAPGAEGGALNAHWRGNRTGGGADASKEGRKPATVAKGAVASELFIAQVTRIEALASTPTLPLLYHRRKFTSCTPAPDSLS